MAFNSRFKKCRAGFGLGFGCDFCVYAGFCSPIKVTIYLFIESILNTVCVMFSYSEGGLYILIAHTAGFICMYK